MNLQKNMETIFFVAAITSVTALAAAQPQAQPIKYTENTIGTESAPAVIIIHGKRPSMTEKLEYSFSNAKESMGLASN
jgi:hypothetical protein